MILSIGVKWFRRSFREFPYKGGVPGGGRFPPHGRTLILGAARWAPVASQNGTHRPGIYPELFGEKKRKEKGEKEIGKEWEVELDSTSPIRVGLGGWCGQALLPQLGLLSL